MRIRLRASPDFHGAIAGDHIHLAVMYPYYAAEIRRHPNWQTAEVRFDWGDEAVFACGPSFETPACEPSG